MAVAPAAATASAFFPPLLSDGVPVSTRGEELGHRPCLRRLSVLEGPLRPPNLDELGASCSRVRIRVRIGLDRRVAIGALQIDELYEIYTRLREKNWTHPKDTLARLATCQSHSRRPPTPFGANAQLLQNRVSRARDPNRRLGGALAARRAVSDRSWLGLAACKERRRMELTLGHHGAILDFAAADRAQISHLVPE